MQNSRCIVNTPPMESGLPIMHSPTPKFSLFFRSGSVVFLSGYGCWSKINKRTKESCFFLGFVLLRYWKQIKGLGFSAVLAIGLC